MQNDFPPMASTEQPVTLTVQDLASIKSIIEVVTARGAFKAEELATVGVVYNKLQAFMAAVSAQPSIQQGEPVEGM
jgi:hypothetical protein